MNNKFLKFFDVPYYDQFSGIIDHKKEEVEEQTLALKYIPSDGKVLELGARFGTVSCAINSVLTDQTAHVAVEPDTAVIQALYKNRETHGGKFHIYNGVVSAVGFSIVSKGRNGYGTYTIPSENPNVENTTLENLISKFQVDFDCLVADCEGFLERFVRENPDFFKKVRVVIYEVDGDCDYQYVENVLTENGLKCVFTGVEKHVRKVFTR
jgi:FkbM family methyltransferase